MLTVQQGVRFGLVAQAAVLAGLAGPGRRSVIGALAEVAYAAAVVGQWLWLSHRAASGAAVAQPAVGPVRA